MYEIVLHSYNVDFFSGWLLTESWSEHKPLTHLYYDTLWYCFGTCITEKKRNGVKQCTDRLLQSEKVTSTMRNKYEAEFVCPVFFYAVLSMLY